MNYDSVATVFLNPLLRTNFLHSLVWLLFGGKVQKKFNILAALFNLHFSRVKILDANNFH